MTSKKNRYRWEQPEHLSCNDAIAFLESLESESVDLIASDPPYGLSFMGSKWDDPSKVGEWDKGEHGRRGRRYTDELKELGSEKGLRLRLGALLEYPKSAEDFINFSQWCTRWATECLRVLRPGGYLLAMGGTRTYDALAWGIRMSGLEIRDCINWVYGQGFPKSQNVGKAWDRVAGAEREVVGERTRTYPKKEGTWSMAGDLANKAAGERFVSEITAPATPEAQLWDGYGTALKPAHEMVCVARKPFQGTMVSNLKEHGTGAVDIDSGRIPASGKPPGWHKTGTVGTNAVNGFQGTDTFKIAERTPEELQGKHDKGRWPPNYIVDHSPDCKVIGTKDTKGRVINRWTDGAKPFGGGAGGEYESDSPGGGVEQVDVWECVDGCPVRLVGEDVSRFFTLPSEADPKDLALHDVGYYTAKVHPRGRMLPGYLMIKADKKDDGSGVNETLAEELCIRWEIPVEPDSTPLDTLTGWPIPKDAVPAPLLELFQEAKSIHPTMKPPKLMAWLIRLYSPRPETVGRDVVVVDPFMGSGTTLVAAHQEGRVGIGNDFTEKYVAIVDARLRSSGICKPYIEYEIIPDVEEETPETRSDEPEQFRLF